MILPLVLGFTIWKGIHQPLYFSIRFRLKICSAHFLDLLNLFFFFLIKLFATANWRYEIFNATIVTLCICVYICTVYCLLAMRCSIRFSLHSAHTYLFITFCRKIVHLSHKFIYSIYSYILVFAYMKFSHPLLDYIYFLCWTWFSLDFVFWFSQSVLETVSFAAHTQYVDCSACLTVNL